MLPPVSPADFNVSFNTLLKYTTEVRKDVDQFMASADLLTRLRVNSDVLEEYQIAVERYYPLDGFDDSEDSRSDGSETEVEEKLKNKDDAIDIQYALPVIHEARVLQLQIQQILPILESRKASEKVVPAKTSETKVGDKISPENENKAEMTDKENDKSGKINGDGDENKDGVHKEIERKVNESINVKKPVNETLEKKEYIEEKDSKEKKEDIEEKKKDNKEKEEDIEKKKVSDAEDGYEKKIAENIDEMTTFVFAGDSSDYDIIADSLFENLSICSVFVPMLNHDCTEGAFIYTVNISTIVSVESPVCVVQNLGWQILVKVKNDADKSGKRNLAVYLKGVGKSGHTWSCFVDFQLILSNRKDADKNIWSKFSRSISTTADSWGWADVWDWDELMNPANGYIKNGSIIFVAIIKPQKPQLKKS